MRAGKTQTARGRRSRRGCHGSAALARAFIRAVTQWLDGANGSTCARQQQPAVQLASAVNGKQIGVNISSQTIASDAIMTSQGEEKRSCLCLDEINVNGVRVFQIITSTSCVSLSREYLFVWPFKSWFLYNSNILHRRLKTQYLKQSN